MAADVSFNAFVVSLATTAAVHFGDVADRTTGAPGPANVEGAARAIEMLVILEEKTRGNLTDDEQAFLTQVLSELRLRLLKARQAAPAAAG